ncbi:MAG: hypothetical protein U9R27_04735 [Campylobacterota bacterium]|nr:hypothetical protein [Campylobacterota bacterium]
MNLDDFNAIAGQVIFATHRGSKPKEVLDTLRKHKIENRKKSKITHYEKE